MYQDGNTELLIGSILNENPDLRPKIQIATKANPFKPEKGYCLSKDSIIQQLTKSLSSLQTDHGVDLYYLHAPDVNNSLQDSLATIQQEYENGKFKRFGLSNYATWEVVFIHSYMKERGWIVPTVYQGLHSYYSSYLLIWILKCICLKVTVYQPHFTNFTSLNQHQSICK